MLHAAHVSCFSGLQAWTVNCPGFNECAEENQEQDVVVHWFIGSLFNGGCLTAVQSKLSGLNLRGFYVFNSEYRKHVLVNRFRTIHHPYRHSSVYILHHIYNHVHIVCSTILIKRDIRGLCNIISLMEGL